MLIKIQQKYTHKIVYVGPATKNFVAFTNGTKYTVSA